MSVFPLSYKFSGGERFLQEWCCFGLIHQRNVAATWGGELWGLKLWTVSAMIWCEDHALVETKMTFSESQISGWPWWWAGGTLEFGQIVRCPVVLLDQHESVAGLIQDQPDFYQKLATHVKQLSLLESITCLALHVSHVEWFLSKTVLFWSLKELEGRTKTVWRSSFQGQAWMGVHTKKARVSVFLVRIYPY